MQDKIFEGTDLDQLRQQASEYINQMSAKGWQFVKIQATRKEKLRSFIVWMSEPAKEEAT